MEGSIGSGQKSITIKFLADTARASKDIKNLGQDIKNLGQAIKNLGQDAENAIKKIEKAFAARGGSKLGKAFDHADKIAPGTSQRVLGIADTARASKDIKNLGQDAENAIKKIEKAFAARGGSKLGKAFDHADKITPGTSQRVLGSMFPGSMAKMGLASMFSALPSAIKDPFSTLRKQIDTQMPSRIKDTPLATSGKSGGFFSTLVENIRNLHSTSSAAGGNLMALARVLGTLAPVALAAYAAFQVFKEGIEKVFNYGNLVEGSKVMLEVAFGNEKKAKQVMEQAIKFSTATPFTPSQVFSATATAGQFGWDPFTKGKYGLQKDKHVMDIIGGMASYRDIHGNPLGMERAAYTIARGDRRLIRPYGAPVQGAFDTALGAGKAGSTAFQHKFIEELGKIPQVMEMAAKHSESMKGLWSTISGFAEEFFISVSGANEETGVTTFWSQVRSILKDIRDWGLEVIDGMKPKWVEFGAFIGSVFRGAFDIMVGLFRTLEPIIAPLFAIVMGVGRVIGALFTGIFRTVGQIFRGVGRIVGALTGWLNKMLGIKSLSEVITNIFGQFVAGIQMMFQFLGIFLEWAIEGIIRNLKAFFDSIADLINRVTKFLGLQGTKEYRESSASRQEFIDRSAGEGGGFITDENVVDSKATLERNAKRKADAVIDKKQQAIADVQRKKELSAKSVNKQFDPMTGEELYVPEAGKADTRSRKELEARLAELESKGGSSRVVEEIKELRKALEKGQKTTILINNALGDANRVNTAGLSKSYILKNDK